MRFNDLTGIQIVQHRFSPFRFGKGRSFSWVTLIVFFAFPLAAGAGLSYLHPVITDRHQGTFLAVYSILAAVLVGLLPIVQNIIGFTSPALEKKYGQAEYQSWSEQVSRFQVLRELYADICFTVLLLVVSLIPIMAIESSVVPPTLRRVMVGFVYYVGVSVALSFFHIASSIYLVLDHHARLVYANLIRNGPTENRDTTDRVA